MRTFVVAISCALAALPASIAAQGEPAAAAPGCFIQVPTLMAAPPAGIADLGTALRQLDEALRPQVQEINRLKAEIARMETPQGGAAPAAQAGFEGDSPVAAMAALPLPGGENAEAEELQKLRADLEARQAQLRLDYAAQQAAIVGPVQVKVSERAQAFAAQRQCTALKMARPPDLAALQTAGARDVTGEFVSWYSAN